MRRSIIEGLVACAASLAIVGAVFVAGTSTMQNSARSGTSPGSRATSITLPPASDSDHVAQPATPPSSTATSIVRPVTPAQPSSAAGVACRRASIVALANSGVRGHAELCVMGAGMRPQLEAGGLTAGHAYAALLGYFDRSASCRTPICQIGDTLGQDPVGVLARLDGGVASRGEAAFGGDVRDLHPSQGSQIVLFLFGNGQASSTDNRLRARQLLTPRSPSLGAPAAGVIADGEVGLVVGYAAFEFRPDPS
jgi:hypothetical protein